MAQQLPGFFVDYIREIKVNGSYLIKQEILDRVDVKDGQVVGDPDAVKVVEDAYNFMKNSK